MTAASRQQVEPASGERWDRQSQQPHSPAFTTRSLDLRTGGPPVGWEQGLQVESRLLFRPHLPPFPSLSLISAPPRMGPEQSMRVMGETVLGDAPLWGPPPTPLPQNRLCRGTSTPHSEADPGSPGRRDGGEVLPHGLDHSSPPHPEARTDSNPSIKQQPDGSRRFLQDCALFINEAQSHQGPDGITRRKQNIQVTRTNVHTYR